MCNGWAAQSWAALVAVLLVASPRAPTRGAPTILRPCDLQNYADAKSAVVGEILGRALNAGNG
jgi:hypothetical protein